MRARRILLAGSALLCLSIGMSPIAAQKRPNALTALSDPHPAVNAPDQFAWQLFIDINQPAKDGTNNVIWESWATDDETFPPNPDPKNPPQWPGNKKRPKVLRKSFQLELFRRLLDKDASRIGPHPLIPQQGEQEEVRRNKATFDFIVLNNLWHLNGLVDAYKAGKVISFPLDSIEIKAHWKPINDQAKPRFHWNIDANGKLYGLIALHITSKILPNWFWATFEHVDNPGRGKALGCGDSFGLVPPNSCNGEVSPALLKLFQQAGMSSEWGTYRLAGAQTEFTDSTGRSTLLGNSEIEGPFITTSSCITCHARAAVDGNGVFLPIFKSTLPLEGNVGTPDPSWFFTSNGGRKNIQLDFVWGFSFASPLKTK